MWPDRGRCVSAGGPRAAPQPSAPPTGAGRVGADLRFRPADTGRRERCPFPQANVLSRVTVIRRTEGREGTRWSCRRSRTRRNRAPVAFRTWPPWSRCTPLWQSGAGRRPERVVRPRRVETRSCRAVIAASSSGSCCEAACEMCSASPVSEVRAAVPPGTRGARCRQTLPAEFQWLSLVGITAHLSESLPCACCVPSVL